MSSRRKRSRGIPFDPADIANIARSNPYVQRLVNDPKLRKNVRTAIRSTKRAYGRVSNGKVPARALLEDRKLHAELGRALAAARDATIALSRTQRRRRRKRMTLGRMLVLLLIGGGAALAGSEKLRSKVLDLLFGAEEEFQYTPPSNSGSSESTSTVGAA
jgi:hypothetical protein